MKITNAADTNTQTVSGFADGGCRRFGSDFGGCRFSRHCFGSGVTRGYGVRGRRCIGGCGCGFRRRLGRGRCSGRFLCLTAGIAGASEGARRGHACGAIRAPPEIAVVFIVVSPGLERIGAELAGADADDLVEGDDEDLAVARRSPPRIC